MNTNLTITIFELGGCCSTSLMDPTHYSEITELDLMAKELKTEGVNIIRINAAMKPELLNAVPEIDNYLKDKDMDVFPLTIINDNIIKDKSYPTVQEIKQWLSVNNNQ